MQSYGLHYDYQTNKIARISPTGSALVSEPKRLTGGGFVGSLDTMAWTVGNTGAASSATVVNIATLVSGTASGGYGSIQTANQARFLYASANTLRGTFRIPTLGVTTSTQKWGAFNYGVAPAIQDGAFFSYNGTNLQVNITTGGVTTTVTNGSFNGETTMWTMDTIAHNYEIIYQVAGTWFLVDGIFLHKFAPVSTLLTSTTTFFANALSVNTAASTGGTLEVWASSIVRYGSSVPAPQFKNITALGTTTIKLGPGTLHTVVLNTASGNTNTVTLFDSTTGSGTTIAKITNVLGSINTISYDLDFINGLTVVVATGTAGDVTVVYD